MKDYVKIFITFDQTYYYQNEPEDATREISSHRFIRTYKSYIISVDKITAIKRDLVCIGNLELPLSEVYKANLERILL
jgi:DNA-binding LytR/AlgR family response regulator